MVRGVKDDDKEDTMVYTDLYFLENVLALGALLIAVTIACYWAHRHYRRNHRNNH